MTRRRALVAVGLVVLLIAAVVVWRTTRATEPSAREQFRSRLAAAPGVVSLRWSYTGSSVAVVRLPPRVTATQVRRLVGLGHRRCCRSVLESGSVRMELDDRATTRSAALFAALARADVPASVTVPAHLPNLVTVRTNGTQVTRALATSQRLLTAGGSRLDGLLVQTTGQDLAHYVVTANDLGDQVARNRLDQILGVAADPSLGVEQVSGSAEAASVQLHAEDRSQASQLWRRATAALRGHGVDALEVRIGAADDPAHTLTAPFGAPFTAARPAG
ncbi:hypothetical protein D9V37_17085 [Nocardioides mangrovicus]|uniref:Uncharacterized protein n=1 Tax=Nocardioides mangrovicus TaxID=2478913 RepID=A0A3L8NX58_9ACTN|nr:hypothetical protein [Nocardioides mangrovicus]RLV47836.1 hypothetical protein D9V37_17085 [Nocardioides mangrovicus]